MLVITQQPVLNSINGVGNDIIFKLTSDRRQILIDNTEHSVSASGDDDVQDINIIGIELDLIVGDYIDFIISGVGTIINKKILTIEHIGGNTHIIIETAAVFDFPDDDPYTISIKKISQTAPRIKCTICLYDEDIKYIYLYKDEIINEYIFNLKDILNHYVSYDLQTSIANEITDALNGVEKLQIYFNEIFFNDKNYYNQIAGDEVFGNNFKITNSKYINTVSDYILNNELTTSFLTNMPTTFKMRVGELIQLSLLTTGTNTEYVLGIGGGDYTNITTEADKLSFNYLLTSQDVIDFGKDIELLAISSLIGGQTKKYNIQVIDACLNPIRLLWLNHLGGIDSYTFSGDYNLDNNNKKETYTDIYDVKQIAQITNGSYEYEVESEFESSNMMNWLGEIINSKQVWYLKEEVLESILITSNSVKIKEADKMMQMKLKFELVNKKIF